MFQIAINCKKCPSSEQATVCHSGQKAAVKLVPIQKANESHLNTVQNSDKLSVFTNSPSNQAKNHFFVQTEDDRSTLHSKNVHPIAKIALLVLLTMHSLSETPGLGSSGPSLSQFVISNHELAVQSAGLKLS